MRRTFILLLLFLISVIDTIAQINTQLIDSLGQITLEKTGLTGAYLSIIKDDSIFYSSAFGYNNPHTKLQINDSTTFPISSNTKAFNCILLSQLVEKGALDLNEPIKTYLPDLKFKNDFITSEVTLTDLLTHRFGFPRYDYTYYLLSDKEKENPNKSVFNKLKYLETTSSFRTQFQYGNNQYILAAYLIEVLTKNKWENLLNQQILSPLKMSNTHCDLERYENSKNMSLGYQNGKLIDIQLAAPLYSVSGMGNMFSTVRDLEKWCKFLMNGNDSILSPQLLRHNFKGLFAVGYEEPYPGFSSLEYGLGWFVFDYYGHKVVLHHGDNVGHQSLVVLLPEDKISWIIISNEGFSSKSFPFRMTFSLLDLFLERKLNDWNTLLSTNSKVYLKYPDSLKTKNTNPTLSIRKYDGEYFHEGFGTIKIFIVDDKLRVQAGSYSDELIHWEYDSFISYAEEFKEDYIFKFELNDKNQIISLKTDLIEPKVGLLEFKKRH